MNRNILITILTLCLALNADAGLVKGKVKDANGEALPFATVYIQGSANGTSANANGEYQLYLDMGSYKITCQYIGFRQAFFSVSITGNETINHDFVLQDQSLEMKGVVIKANSEDPAYAIIRKAIARREYHLQQLRSFQSSIYLKGVLRNKTMGNTFMGMKVDSNSKKEMGLDSAGKGLLYLCEQEATYYSQGNNEKTIIKSVRQSGNPNGLGMSQLPAVVTFYENNVVPIEGVTPRGFVSPISDNALHYYKYRFEGSFMENGYLINKITVIPKRDYEPLLKGTIYIVEDDWAIHSLSLLATTKSNMEMLDSLRIDQTHLPLKKDTWVIKNQVLHPHLVFLLFDVAGYFMTVYDGQKVNEPIPDSVFGSKVTSVYEKDANKKDTSYWTDKRPVPLETDESKDYSVKDSIRAVRESPEYRDSVRRKLNRVDIPDILTTGFTINSKEYKNSYSFSRGLVSIVNYNTVEGVSFTPHFATTHRIDTGKRIVGEAAIRYGFSNTHLNAIAKYYYQQSSKDWRGRYHRIGLQGGKYVFQYNPRSTITPLYNTIATLLRGYNYMKVYERWDGAVFYERNYGNGFELKAKANFQKRLPLANTTHYTFSKKDVDRLTANYPLPLQWINWEEHNAALFKASVSYQPGYTYTQYPDYKTPQGSPLPTFTLSYEKGIPGILDSKTDFDKWRFSVKDDVPLKLLGSLSYDIAAGGFLSKKYVSLPDMMHIADNRVFPAAPYLGSFQLAPYYKYSNLESLYGELHVEYYMKGLLTNKIPLLRQAKWYMILGNNTFYASQANYYTEAFVSITNLGWKMYRFLRVDFVQGWDNFSNTYTGIRLGFDLSTLGGSVGITDYKDNWE